MSVHAGRLNQAHHGSRTLPGAKAPSKQPVAASNGDGANLVLNPVVVHVQLPVIHESGERLPTPEAVVQCFGYG